MKHKILMTLIVITGLSIGYVLSSLFQEEWNPLQWFYPGWIGFIVFAGLIGGWGAYIYHTLMVWNPKRKEELK